MLRRHIFVLMVFLVSVLTYRTHHGAETKSSWNARMQDLAKAMSDALPDLYSGSAPRNADDFKNKIKKIYFISRDIDQSSGHGLKAPDNDLTVPYISHLYREEIERAYWSLESGQTEYAKSIVRSSVSYCIACHTRTQMGPEFPMIAAFNSQMKAANWVDRVSFQAASRQYDSAFKDVMSELEKGNDSAVKAFDLEKSINIALAVAIRVRQNPEQAEQLAKAVSESPRMTADMKSKAKTWLKDIAEWKVEKKKSFKTANDYIAVARPLVGDLKASGETTWVPGNEVRFLRASVLMHDLLRKYPKSDLSAEALFLIGLSYDVLQDLGIWSLHDMYYQACIERKPHSDLARRCYDRYKESITLGYTGSSGVRIPSAVQIQLSRLERLANPIVYFDNL